MNRFVISHWILCAALALASFPVLAAEPNTLTPRELTEGWILLFDGETRFGWTAGSEANWSVRDGAIAVSEGQQGLLCTTSEFGDYQLQVDFRAPEDTNSGVFLRTALKPQDVSKDCYELNIAPPNNPFPTGGFVKRQKAEGAQPRLDQWNTFDVTAQGGHFAVRLNGRQVLDYTDPKPALRRFIGLQINQGPVEFRNVKLRPLGLKSLFNGKDLAGWREPEGNYSVFTVTPEGWLNVKGGKGALESDGRYGDFALQLEAILNAPRTNSGLFFRCIPGQLLNGYELQLDNRYQNNDRTQPADAGTGAIYRRQSARRVVPNDQEWFYTTLIASGPHLATWVNGYPVVDFTDNRPVHENPRQGSRTVAGSLQLQGHDATTQASFRNLRVGELPAPKE